MCGIVGYFGDHGNGLTRILGAMASILYRAPDSTGAAWFGDEREPVRVRKTVGALPRFVETQLSDEDQAGEGEILASLCSNLENTTDRREMQRALLSLEGFAEQSVQRDRGLYSAEAGDPDGKQSPNIVPGTCGDPSCPKEYRIQSADEFSRFIEEGIDTYDLPPLVARTLLRKALSETLSCKPASHIDGQTGSRLVDELFEQAMQQLNLVVASAEPELSRMNLPQVGGERYQEFLGLLQDTTVTVPQLFSPDPVRRLFRLLDGAVLSRLALRPELQGKIQRSFEGWFPRGLGTTRLPWVSAYRAEKQLNVFGRAAAAAWINLCTEQLPAGSASTPGWKDIEPEALSYFRTPIIGHGRWALQSPVADNNAHPFVDEEGRRAVVLNGQFSPTVEGQLCKFLTKAGFRFHSENSVEYLSLLWGHYFDIYSYERKRGESLQAQVDDGLGAYCPGSQSIDYQLFSLLRGKSDPQLDALAFRQAAAKICADGGQMAAAGISLHSPHCLFVASHNRPVFLVRRHDTQEIMVVSDINAALGLFSQQTIQKRARELKELRRQQRISRLKEKEKRILETFRVVVLPLEGERLFACVESSLEAGTVRRRITVSDFDGRPIHDLEEFETVLNPLQVEKEVFASFFETHLREIPARLQDILDAYLPEGIDLPRLTLRRRLLNRRFDKGLAGLERVVLVGMGSSYHAGLMARTFCRHMLPSMETLLLRPVEVEHALRMMEPEKDLVILLSWSGTTADMVEFARELEESRISFIVVTNKPYSELGLFAWRSLGVVNLLSGEEVTFSSVKSTCSMLFGIQLLIVWLARLGEPGGTAEKELADLNLLPQHLEALLHDSQIEHTALQWAQANAGCSVGIVFDDLLSANTGREAAWKLEENGRSIVCRALDYRDTLPQSFRRMQEKTMVLLNATSSARIAEAVDLAKRLYLAGVEFAVCSFQHSLTDALAYYSGERVVILPKLGDSYQPYADLLFFYLFTLRLVEQSKSGVPGFPRNRVKSVTSARSRQRRFPLPAAAMAAIRKDLERTAAVPAADLSMQTLWESRACTAWERQTYSQVREVCRLLLRKDPLEALFPRSEPVLKRLGPSLFDELGEGGEVLFLCCDRTAWAAAYEVAAVWGRLLQVPLRVFYRFDELYRERELLPIVVIASEVPDRDTLEQLRKAQQHPLCWIGPRLEERYAQSFNRSLGCCSPRDDGTRCSYARLYAGTLLLLATAWSRAAGEKARPLQSLLCSAGKAVAAVLADGTLKDAIDSFWKSMRERESAFFISPPSGIGYVWERYFDASGAMCVEHHVYGDCSHGPIATVDPQIEEKYIRLQSREELAGISGESESPAVQFDTYRKRGLLHAEGGWYLPQYAADYDLGRDNLIILDATRSRYFEQARDEMEIFSSRNARMLLISQRPLYAAISEEQLLADCTAGQPVLLPPLDGGPIPDLLLPFVGHLLAAAFASACLEAKGISGRTPPFTFEEKKSHLLRDRLHRLGQILDSFRIELNLLSHWTLAALERLAPLVESVEEARHFEVQRFASEKTLRAFLLKQGSEQADTLLEHFRIALAQGIAFFLMRMQNRLTRPQADAGTVESAEHDSWQEAFGSSWTALSSGQVQIDESPDGHPLIELPLLPSSKRKGSLLRLHVRYLEWDHTRVFESQIGETLEAMQRGMISLKTESAGYLTLVNSFDRAVEDSGASWTDWLIVLVPRPWLLYKASLELARLLAERCLQLLELIPEGGDKLERIEAALASVWKELGGIEKQSEPSRWRSLVAKLKKQLRGVKR